jgi:hypothetical protein
LDVRAAWLVVATIACAAPVARADEADEVRELERRLDANERRIRELEGSSMTRDEVAASIDRYFASHPSPALVGGAEDKGSARFPEGKRPYIKEGPNKLEFGLRTQVRYETFLYSRDAVGTLASPADTVDDAAPRDRSGFEVERLTLTIGGSVFCEDITFRFQTNFDSDRGTGLDKRQLYIDWRFAGEHHVRAGGEKVAHTYEEQNSAGELAFVDRGLLRDAFGLGYDQGISFWGTFGSTECPERLLYKIQAMNGEGRTDRGSPFADAFDTRSNQLLFVGFLEWTITCFEFDRDEVDHRPCEERCEWAVATGVSGYYENDDDDDHAQHGLRLGADGPLDRTGICAWVRAHWNGWSFLVEGAGRHVDYTGDSDAEDQTDYGLQAVVHYRFADSNWGVGVRGTVIRLDDDYDTVTVGSDTVDLEDTIWDLGVVVNYFFWDHVHKVSADLTYISENSAVSSTAPGYLVDATRGVVVEDGWMFRLQWQLSL